MRFRRKKTVDVPVVSVHHHHGHSHPEREGPPRHNFMLSGVEASGTMIFVCRNCPADIRIERATLYTLLVMRSEALQFLPAQVCPNQFPDGLTRILPERHYTRG